MNGFTSEYEFAEKLSPEERDNICRIIGKFAHTTKRRIQIDQFFANEFLDTLSKKIGYEFADIKLLELAITHKSADSKSNNERLEFLGDAILSTVVSEHLYTKFPYQKEGLLTRMRSHLVKGDTLTRIAYNLELTNFIKLSKGTANLSSDRKQSILEGVVEAIIGAVMLDSNWETSKKFVLKPNLSALAKASSVVPVLAHSSLNFINSLFFS